MSDLETTQADAAVRGIATAVCSHGALTDTQGRLLAAVGTHLLHLDLTAADVVELEPLGPDALADAIGDDELRRRAVHAMVTLEIIADPVPTDVSERVERYARALQVDEAALAVARDYAATAMDVAAGDLLRNSYVASYYSSHQTTGHGPDSGSATGQTDPALAARWQALEDCPPGSHGRSVWDFYQARGFTFPGEPGAVDPLLAQHDWVHCLADYGTSAMGEIEVFTFIASAIPDPSAFSFAIIILGLFETGYVPFVPGVATSNPGHLSRPGGTERFVDALSRGLAVQTDIMGGTDWFQTANLPIDDVRNQFGVPPKGDAAINAGTLSATDPDAVFGRDQ